MSGGFSDTLRYPKPMACSTSTVPGSVMATKWRPACEPSAPAARASKKAAKSFGSVVVPDRQAARRAEDAGEHLDAQARPAHAADQHPVDAVGTDPGRQLPQLVHVGPHALGQVQPAEAVQDLLGRLGVVGPQARIPRPDPRADLAGGRGWLAHLSAPARLVSMVSTAPW